MGPIKEDGEEDPFLESLTIEVLRLEALEGPNKDILPRTFSGTRAIEVKELLAEEGRDPELRLRWPFEE